MRQLAGETRAGESIPFIKFVTFRFITIQSRGNGGSALRGDKRRGSRRARPSKSAPLFPLRDEIDAARFANWTNDRSKLKIFSLVCEKKFWKGFYLSHINNKTVRFLQRKSLLLLWHSSRIQDSIVLS